MRRTWAIALVTFRQGMRMRLWILVPLAVLSIVVADLSSPRFDPVLEAIPAAISTSLFVMAVLAVLVGIFFATYAIPTEIETRVVTSVAVKPVSRPEMVLGKTVGLSFLVLVMLGAVGVGAYGYLQVRASTIRSIAGRRLEEARPRAVYPVDLNALKVTARQGPLGTYRYRAVDVGPQIAIHYGAEKPGEADFLWILGETGMRLTWNLSQTPLREWVAGRQASAGLPSQGGPCRLRLSLQRRPPPETPEASTRVLVGWSAASLEPPKEGGAPSPVYRVELDVPAAPLGVDAGAGDLEVPLAASDAPPTQGVLNVPAGGKLILEVLAEKQGHLVGAGADALYLVGPAGQEAKTAPTVAPPFEQGKILLVGRLQPPRGEAVFGFKNVPPDVLGDAEAALEVSCSVDSYNPALIQTAAEMTLRRPDTGREETFRFSPESQRPTLLPMDRSFWCGGSLEARLQCLTTDDFLGVVPASVRLRLPGGPFAWNFAKAILRVWLFGTVLASIGVMLSTRLTWFVSILGSMVLLVLGTCREFLLGSTSLGKLAWNLTQWNGGWLDTPFGRRLAQHLVLPVPDFSALLPGTRLSLGEVMPLTDLGAAVGWSLVAVAITVSIGSILMKRREVAA